MRVGIVTDSHGDYRRLKEAMRILMARSTDAIVHCGDIGGGGCIELLGQSSVPVHLVAGNTDADVESIAQQAAIAGIHFSPNIAIVPLEGGRQLAATHGHDPQIMVQLIGSQQFDYVAHGHTHRTRDQRVGKTRIINSGALHRTSQPTLAVLDTTTDELSLLPVLGNISTDTQAL
jgi:uncharacterized protein